MSTTTVSRRRTASAAAHRPAPGDQRRARYRAAVTAVARELVTIPAADGGTLLIDPLANTSADARVVGHLAADEPAENIGRLAEMYLADPSRGRCAALLPGDTTLTSAASGDAPACQPDPELLDGAGHAYRVLPVRGASGPLQLRWTRSLDTQSEQPGEILALRKLIGRLELYEPARAITLATIAPIDGDVAVSTVTLRGELERLDASPLILNRRLREVIQARLATGTLTMSEIATRCGRVKHDRRGRPSGEASWLARRIGAACEAGATMPSPWIHHELLALIARQGLGLAPYEVEV